ncbi:hypothetical protein RYX36_020081 [Vicia faba]
MQEFIKFCSLQIQVITPKLQKTSQSSKFQIPSTNHHHFFYKYPSSFKVKVQGSPITPINSNSTFASDPTAPWILSEEIDSGTKTAYAGDINNNITVKSHELRLHELNTLEWDELVVTNDLNASTVANGLKNPCFDQQNQILPNDSFSNAASNASTEVRSFNISTQPIPGSYSVPFNFPEGVTLQTIDNQGNQNESRNHPVPSSGIDSFNTLINDRLQSQDNLGMWVNPIMYGSPFSVDDSALGSSVSSVVDNQQLSLPEQIFNLTDVFPA